LREALAAANHDFVLTGPGSKLNDLRSKLFAAKRHSIRRRVKQGGRYLPMLAAFVFAATAAAILVNALLWQKARHPAPLFARAVPAAGKKPAASQAPAPRTAPAIASSETAGKTSEAPDGQNAPTDKPQAGSGAGAQAKASVSGSSARPRDPIAQLLQGGQEPAARPASAPAKPSAASKSVLTAQRALVKLGFVLQADGVAGQATRQAIERYQKDHGLPADGNLTPALARRLGAETGTPVN
jgi:hypothetical protein